MSMNINVLVTGWNKDNKNKYMFVHVSKGAETRKMLTKLRMLYHDMAIYSIKSTAEFQKLVP